MTSFTIKHFDILEYVKQAKEAGINQNFAEYTARQFEQQQEIIQSQQIEIDTMKLKEPLTKSDIFTIKEDIKNLELKIEQYRYDSLKFVVWTGVGVVFTLSGIIFTLLKLMIH